MISIDPDIGKKLEQPLGMQKFTLWASMQKACMAARGPNGIYCSWEGKNCGYTGCPRRIFEEVIMDENRIVPPQPVKLKIQLQEQSKMIDALNQRLTELENKKEN